MNTKKAFLVIVIICNMIIMSPLVFAENKDQAVVGSDQWALELTSYIHDVNINEVPADKDYLQNQRKIIEGLLDRNNTNPVYLFLRGRLIDAGLTLYLNENKEKFKVWGSFGSDPYVISERKILYQSYDDALKFDNDGSAMRLSRKMLAMITRDLGASVDTRVLASRKQLLFPPPDGVDFYYNIYHNIISHYMDAHRYDDAINALDEMLQKLPDRQAEIEQARGDILSRKLKYETELTEEAEKNLAPDEQSAIQVNTNSNDAVSSITPEQSSLLKQTILNNLSRWEWQALIVGLALVAVGALYLRRKK